MVNLFFILLPAAVLHWFAEKTGGENAGIDLCIPVIWIAEGILWIFVLNFTNQEKHRKRNLMAAWIICLLLFELFTYADISYLSPPAIWDSVRGKYWNKVIFFCSPILLLSVMKMLEIYITEEKPYFLQKRKLLYFIIVLLLLVLTVILLWNWNQKDRFLNQCAGYLAVGYMLKMSVSFILQANLVVSPYMEFPFSGMDMAEILLPILLVYEGCHRTKNEEVTIMGLRNYDHAAERS